MKSIMKSQKQKIMSNLFKTMIIRHLHQKNTKWDLSNLVNKEQYSLMIKQD